MDWVAIGLCADVPPGTVVPRRVNGTDVALWCSQGGHYHVWGDRCPHRGMRLSHGFVRAETLACIYHGWQYDADGACAYIPAHPDLVPPRTICATRFTCRARGGVIWFSGTGTVTDLPDVAGRSPVRSIDMSLGAQVVADRLGHALTPVIPLQGPHDLALALQPSTADSCFVHALAAPGQNLKDVSRHLEGMRAEMEAAA